jgi:hypothetical protein
MRGSGRRNGISSRFDLPHARAEAFATAKASGERSQHRRHHRTYGSVYGGSLLYIFRCVDVVFSYPAKPCYSCLFFGFRPILSVRSLLLEHLTFTASVTFIYYPTARFGPSGFSEASIF